MIDSKEGRKKESWADNKAGYMQGCNADAGNTDKDGQDRWPSVPEDKHPSCGGRIHPDGGLFAAD